VGCGRCRRSLNRAVAVGFADGPAAGLAAWTRSRRSPSSLGTATSPRPRADFLLRLGRIDEARTAYQEALLLTENTVERDYLTNRPDQLQD